MTSPTKGLSPDFSRAELERLRDKFLGIAPNTRIHMLHRATNAEAEGVVGIPYVFQGNQRPGSHHFSMGNRDGWYNVDEKGAPKFVDVPALDIDGKAIAASNGQGFDIILPAYRRAIVTGPQDEVKKLTELTTIAGGLVSAIAEAAALLPLRWQINGGEPRWWTIVFELGWSGRLPSQRPEKLIWYAGETYVKHDPETVRMIMSSDWEAPRQGFPERWHERLPDAYMSTIDQAATACYEAVGVVLEMMDPNPEEPGATAQKKPLKAWAPPVGYVGVNTIMTHERFQKRGKNPPRTTIQTWQRRSDAPKPVKAPDNNEVHLPEVWIMQQIATWNPQRLDQS